MTAETVKEKLRKRYPATQWMGDAKIPGPWVTVTEWSGIDLLAVGVTDGSKREWIGHEVKVSRSDLRAELLNPWKRQHYKRFCDRLYLVVPDGLLKPDELAYDEPDWTDDDFKRQPCPGACRKMSRKYVVTNPEWTPLNGTSVEFHIECAECGGKGHVGPSLVETEAPRCWVPRDLGLIVITGRGQREIKPAPKHGFDDLSRRDVADLLRWVSARPDPRHDGVVEEARRVQAEQRKRQREYRRQRAAA